MRLIPADPPTPARARVLAGLAAILMLQRGYLESRVVADEAIAMARSTGTRQIEGHALNTRAEDRVHEGEVEEALEDMAEAMRIARETANLDDIGRAYANVIDVLEVSGRLEEAVAAAFEGLEDTRRLGLLTFFGTHLLCNAGSLLYRLGRWDDADAAVVRADEIGASGVNEILVREMRARLALARGQFEVAAEELRTARPMAERAADGQVIGPVHASLAELALWQHRPAEAAEVIETGIVGLAHSSDIRYAEVWTLGIRAYADLADLARARRSTSDAEVAIAAGNAIRDGLRRRHGERVPPAIAGQAELWTLLADAEARRLEGVPDPDAWATAAQAWADAGRPYPAAYARWREAEAAMALDGDRRRASAAIATTLDDGVRTWRPAPRAGGRVARGAGAADRRRRARHRAGASPDPPWWTKRRGSGSPRASATSSRWSPSGARTARSARRCSSPRTPPASTCRTSCPSSACPGAARRRRWPTTSAWSIPPPSR